MLQANESERLQHAHTLWRLASQHAAGDISHEEYEEKFWALLGRYSDAFALKKLSSRPLPYGRKDAANSADVEELCAI